MSSDMRRRIVFRIGTNLLVELLLATSKQKNLDGSTFVHYFITRLPVYTVGHFERDVVLIHENLRSHIIILCFV
jgi:hypothetical protein